MGHINELVNMKRIGNNGFSHDIGDEVPVIFVCGVNTSGHVSTICVKSSASLRLGLNPVQDFGGVTTILRHIPKSSGDSVLLIFGSTLNSHFVKLFVDVGSDLRDVGLGQSEYRSFDLDEIRIKSENVGPEPCNDSINVLGEDKNHKGQDYYFVRFEILKYLGVHDLESFP